MDRKAWAANNLAAALLAAPWTPQAIADGMRAVLGPLDRRTKAALIAQVLALGEAGYPPAPHALASCLLRSDHFKPQAERRIKTVLQAPIFAPAPGLTDLPVPTLATPGDLAAWLGQPPEQLEWLADQRRQHLRANRSKLQHYTYAWIGKRGGSFRLLEAPKPRLKAIQRRILREILSPVPVHGAAHGFVAGRSCLSGAQLHASEHVVATFDLAQFFPSIGLPRIHGLFRRVGYPWAVARLLAGLCTTCTPTTVLRGQPGADWAHGPLFSVPHLPQGAPTSPILANLVAWKLDLRLHRLAHSAGGNYTRYADDLAFSGDARFAARLDRFRKAMEAVVTEEGFLLNTAKSRIMVRSARQRVTGIVVNVHCNLGRDGFDTLKAILHNCAQSGPAGQNRANIVDFRRHLEGRINWVEQVNPARGEKLRRLFERIDWH